MIREYFNKIKRGYSLEKSEIMSLVNWNLGELSSYANTLREEFCKNTFDLCTIVNAKNGKCSEDCKFCSQSQYYDTKISSYPLLSQEEILQDAKLNESKGILRYSIVTSGRRLTKEEVGTVAKIAKAVKDQTSLEVCVSNGLLDVKDFHILKEHGVTRVHNNLETSRRFFPHVCSTHTYDEKIETIKAAEESGLEVCSGGIIGLGETMEDRIDMCLTLRELGVKSIPVNVLNPIKNTPFENNLPLTDDEVQRTVALFRFTIPKGQIRLAGGRILLKDSGYYLFSSGANAAISGEMLNTSGISTEKDIEAIKALNYRVAL